MDPGTDLIKIRLVSLKVGDKVRVFNGPLAGVNVIVSEMKSKNVYCC